MRRATSDLFAINPDFRESDLAPLPPDDLRKSWGNVNDRRLSPESKWPIPPSQTSAARRSGGRSPFVCFA